MLSFLELASPHLQTRAERRLLKRHMAGSHSTVTLDSRGAPQIRWHGKPRTMCFGCRTETHLLRNSQTSQAPLDAMILAR